MNTKRLTALLISVLMILQMYVVTTSAAEVVDSGACGENLTWTLDSDGVLTISGTGEMYDYDAPDRDLYPDLDPAPWQGLTVTSIIIQDGVTGIGTYAFSSLHAYEVNIPDSVRTIRRDAFNQNNFVSVDIPSGVEVIGIDAFGSCAMLTSFSVSDTVSNIERFPIGSSNLSELTIDPDNRYYKVENSVVYNADKTTLYFAVPAYTGTIVIPDTVKTIYEYAFRNSRAENILVPDSVTSLGFGVFSGLENIKTLVLKEGITSFTDDASWCNNLEAIVLPASLEQWNCYSVYGNPNLKSIFFMGDVPTQSDAAWNTPYMLQNNHPDLTIYYFDGANGFTEGTWTYNGVEYKTVKLTVGAHLPYAVIGTESTCSTEGMADYWRCLDCGKIFSDAACTVETTAEAMTLPTNDKHGVTEIRNAYSVTDTESGYTGDTWCLDCNTKIIDGMVIPAGGGICGDDLVWSLSDGVLTISGTGEMYEYDHLNWNWFYDRDPAPWNGKTVDSVIIENGVTSIGTFAFSGCSLKNGITIPSTVKTIGDGAFENADFEEITIPEGVETIDNAFLNCSTMNRMVLPSTLESITFPDVGVASIEIAADNPHMTVYNGNVYNKSMTKLLCLVSSTNQLVLPETATMIGWGAIASSNLSDIVWNDALHTIEPQNFWFCDSIKTLEIPEGITSLMNSIAWCSNLETIILPASLTDLESNTIMNLNSLTNVYFKGDAPTFEEVVNDEWKTFYNCPNVTVFFDEGAEGFNIVDGTWTTSQGITVNAVEIPAGEEFHLPTYIAAKAGSCSAEGNLAYYHCDLCNKNYEDEACTKVLSSVTVAKDTANHVNVIRVDASDTYSGDLYCNDCQKTIKAGVTLTDTSGICGEDLVWSLTDGVLSISGTGEMYDYEQASWSEGEVNSAPWYSKDIASVVIEEGVTNIGRYAFENTILSDGFTIPSSVKTIETGAFLNSQLKTLTTVSGLETIEDGAFLNGGMTDIYLSDTVKNITAGSFAQWMQTITIDENNPNYNVIDNVLYNEAVTELVFCGRGVQYLVIPDTVTTIKYDAVGTALIHDIEFGAGLITIEDSNLSYLWSMKSLELPEGITTIGYHSLQNNTEMTTLVIPSTVTSIHSWSMIGLENLTSLYFKGNAPELDTVSSLDAAILSDSPNVTVFYDEGAEGFNIVDGMWTTSQGITVKAVMIPEGEEFVPIIPEDPTPENPDNPPYFNGYTPQEDDPSTICFTVPYAEKQWIADGIISEGEYQKMDVKTSQLSYAVANAELKETVLQTPISLYMSYSKNYVYIAAETPADQYVCDINYSNEGNMWAAHAIQLSLADINATDSADRLEVGYALSSVDNEQYACSWFDPMGIAYDPDNNSDYIVVKDGNKLIYEMRVPYRAFLKENLTAGDSFLGSLIWAVGTSEDGGSDAYAHIQLGYGLSGDPGKDPRGHATFTLGEIPEGVEPEETVPDITSIPYVDADTVSVDGEKDSAYENGAVAVIDNPSIGIPAATATASMLTNNGLLYLYIEVTDPRVVIPTAELQASEPWYADSVEFLFQTHNDVFHDVHQFRVDVTDYLSYYRNADGDIQAYGTDAEDYFYRHAVVQTATGYIVEFCIDTKKFGVSAGETIGIQMQLNDADTGNGWTCSTYCNTDNSFNTEYFDTVLIGEGEEYTTTREIPDDPPYFSGYTPQEDDPSTILFDVPYAETEWKADGVISEGEYRKMDVKASQLSYAVANAELKETVLQTPISLYMSYDDNYVYLAATTPADQYVCDIDYSNEGNMWAAHALQLSLADINATDPADRLEVGYALSSLDNELYACSWFDPMGIAYDPDKNGDYIVVREGNKLIYELRVPFEAFVEENLTEGQSFLGSLVWAVGTSEDGGSDAYAHIQLGYGLSGDPGKDLRGHATFTLTPHTHTGGSATCSSRARCSICGEAYGSYSAYNHTSLSTVNAKAATEFEAGYTGDTYCYGCGTTTAYGSVIPATHVHALEAVEAKAATCIAVGNEAYYRCTAAECGKLFSDADGKTELTAIPEIAIDKNNHTQLETVNAKDATETEEGYTGDTVCTDCKITVTEGSVIEKLKPAPVLVDVPVEAVVSGSSVVIESVDESILNVGAPETPDDGEEPDVGEAPDEGELPAEPAPATVVSIDLTVYETEEEKITEAVLPAQVIETITKVVEETDNTVEGVAIHLSTGSMQLDDKTMRAMVEQSEGDTVRLVMEDKTGEELNALQEEVLKELEVHGKVDVYMECEKSGDRISEFNGGTVTLQIPFEIPENCHTNGFQVWYIDEEGNRTPMDTRYENGMIIWEVTHFSDYVIIYEEPAVEEMDNPYTDISEDAWYYGDVLYTYANNLMIGVGNEQFAPGMNLTRSMFVTILWRIAGEPVVTDEISFTDVPADTWYTEAVRWAAANGLVNGYSETAFGPNDNITREQLAAILYRYEQMLGGGFTGMWMFLLDFNDRDEISDWAYEAMCYMNMNGIINGKPEKLLDPQGVATRAEAAAMLRRYHEMKNAEQEEN